MMEPTSLVAAAAASVFGLLSAFHVFWALGGKLGGAAVIPEVRGAPAFTPTRAATVLVALALAAAALVVLAQAGLIARFLPAWLVRIAAIVLGAVFVLRAIGNFRLVGFFKTIHDTRFARYDTFLFSPLCLALGVAVLWLSSRSAAR